MLAVLMQAVGLVAAAVGVFLMLPLGAALVVVGVAVGGLGVLVEVRTPDRPSGDGERYTS